MFILIGWALLMVYGEDSGGMHQKIEFAAIAMAYVCIIGGFIYDMVRIRPIRNQARATAEGMSEAKLNDVIERAIAKDAERKARKGK